MKCVFLVKRDRPECNPEIGFPSSRIRASKKKDWPKLAKTISLALGTNDEVLTSSDDDIKSLH